MRNLNTFVHIKQDINYFLFIVKGFTKTLEMKIKLQNKWKNIF